MNKSIHKFHIRIYFEDTDSLGLVYYANYLKFFERARTEFFRRIGYDAQIFLDNLNVFFVVRNCNLKFILPARLNDKVEVISLIKVLKKKIIHFEQRIELDGNVLVKGDIKLACISSEGHSKEFPDDVYIKLTELVM